MSIPRISSHPRPFINFLPPQGVLLAQAKGDIPETKETWELLNKEDFFKKSLPDEIAPLELETQMSFINAESVDQFLGKSKIRGPVFLSDPQGTKSIGEWFTQGKPLGREEALAIISATRPSFSVIKDPGKKKGKILKGVQDYADLNFKAHAVINYYKRLLDLQGKHLANVGALDITDEALQLFVKKIAAIQDILYQSYQNVAKRLMEEDPSGLSTDDDILSARIILLTGKSNPQEAWLLFTDKIRYGETMTQVEREQKTALTARGQLEHRWFQKAPPVPKPKEEPPPISAKAEALAETEEPPAPPPPPEAPPPPPAAALKTGAGIVEESQAQPAVRLTNTFEASPPYVPKIFSIKASLALLRGSQIRRDLPSISEHHSTDATSFHEAALQVSQRNQTEDGSEGILGSLHFGFHPFGPWGAPWGAPFIEAGAQGGYAGKYPEGPLGLFELQGGLGISLRELFGWEPSFDLAFHTFLLNAYVTTHQEILPNDIRFGLQQVGGCFSVGKLESCIYYWSWQQTGTPTDRDLSFLFFQAGYSFANVEGNP